VKVKKILFILMPLFIVASCSSEESQPTFTQATPVDTIAPHAATPLPPTQVVTVGWPEYVNIELGYSFKYPVGCSYGSMGADGKQTPPEKRSTDDLCFLNTENPSDVILQSFLGNAEDGFTLATFSVRSLDAPAYDPPGGQESTGSLNIEWSYQPETMPLIPNLFIDGFPAVRIYIPGSRQAFATENIFVVRDGDLIHIHMIDVGVEEHQALYENVLATFQFSE
jgi:hypothetical protein